MHTYALVTDARGLVRFLSGAGSDYVTDYRWDGNLEESDRRAGTSRGRGGRGGRAGGSENEVTVRGRRKGEFICMYKYICKYIYIYMSIYICIYTHTYTNIYTHTCTCTYTLYMYICVYIKMYTHIYKCIQVYTQKD